MTDRWRTLWLLVPAELLIMTPWFSATAVCLVWGLAVVTDSAQFSTAVSELADSNYVGTALAMQTCAGFLLTMVSIRLVPLVVEHAGWGLAFVMLAPGPVFGIVSMARLRGLPEATRMASGNRQEEFGSDSRDGSAGPFPRLDNNDYIAALCR